jgi:hypothetical protein
MHTIDKIALDIGYLVLFSLAGAATSLSIRRGPDVPVGIAQTQKRPPSQPKPGRRGALCGLITAGAGWCFS